MPKKKKNFEEEFSYESHRRVMRRILRAIGGDEPALLGFTALIEVSYLTAMVLAENDQEKAIWAISKAVNAFALEDQ